MKTTDNMTRVLLFFLVLGVWGNILVSLSPLLAQKTQTKETKIPTFKEINVERINVIEPGGRLRLVLSNKVRFPDNIMEWDKVFP